MSISFGGLSSGLPVDDIINKLLQIERKPIDILEDRKDKLTLQKSQYEAVKSRVSSLQGTLEQLTSASLLDTDLFDVKKATSSDESLVTATVTEDASPQTLQVEVLNLATATRAVSVSPVGQLVTAATAVSDLAQGTVTSGGFTVFVNGIPSTVAVNAATDTVNDILTQIQGIGGITGASVVGGQLQINFGAGTNVQLGASGDTSNFLAATTLATGTATPTSITGSAVLTSVDLAQDVETAAANLQTVVAPGSAFTIGTASFTTAGKTLNELIAEINNDADAGVTASFNVGANRLELSAKTKGSAMITLQDTAGNFLEAMGLISAGNSTLSQTAGENAQLRINGTTYFSASNTVTETITGLAGVTLELTGEEIGTTVNIDINRDNTDLKTTLNEFITNFNAVISFIDEQTNPQSDKAPLKGERALTRLRNQLRTKATDSVAGLTVYSSLQMVGISTGAVSSSGGSPSSKLQLNTSKLDAALADDPDEVRELMIGATGIMTQLQEIVDQALLDEADANQDGLFASYANFNASRIEDINDAISRGEDRLAKKESLLRKQFQVMDQMIAQAQSQGNAISNLNAQLNANNG